MQRKYYKTKSIQFNNWYEEIIKLKTFGNKENLRLLEEWNRFHNTSTLIKTQKYKKAIKDILKYPLIKINLNYLLCYFS